LLFERKLSYMRKEKEVQDTTPDWLLLRRFVKDNSEEAFAALSARYLNLVYTVCRREVHDPELAQDVTQAVFLLLARTAPKFRSKTGLPGWLFRTARFTSQNALKQEQRRQYYEEKAAMETQAQEPAEDAAWNELEPLLNQSLAALREKDRTCILLRFFQGASFAEVGTASGLSEDAARKRVIRSLGKMRQFFAKNGVIIPAVALPVLLTAHAAKAAPVTCQASIAALTHSVLAGHTLAALTGSHTYQLSEGTLKAMKLIQLKLAVGVTTAVLVGTAATYGVVRGAASAAKSLPPIKIAHPEPPARTPAQEAFVKEILTDSAPSQYRTVALTGKVRRVDGTPAGNIHLSAQVQSADMDKIFTLNPQPASPGKPQMANSGQMEVSGSFAHTRRDGTYTLYVGEGLKYNICVIREDLMKTYDSDTGLVAAAAEGVSGAKGTTVSVPDLVLTPGGIITGTVTDKATGRPIMGATVMSYGPHRPESSAAVIAAQTDSTGTYRLRVAPGRSRVYVSDTFTQQSGADPNRYLEVAEGQTKMQDFQITLK